MTGHDGDHRYTEEENDQFSEEDKVTTISMASSRVDYLEFGKIEPLIEKEQRRYERLKASKLKLPGFANGQVCEPQALGLAVKFHFPINPHFLLYRHPDTNVRTTAWLTVLTSVFALFMQLIFSGGTPSAEARPPMNRPAIVEQTSLHTPTSGLGN